LGVDLDELGERTKVIPPVAATVDPHSLAGRLGKRLDRLGGDGWPLSIDRPLSVSRGAWFRIAFSSVIRFGLGLGYSLIAGFGMAASAGHSWIHMVLFAGTLTIALYVVTDLEYPRLGLIRIEAFDHFFKDAYDQMR
jgi:hypothetical protein